MYINWQTVIIQDIIPWWWRQRWFPKHWPYGLDWCKWFPKDILLSLTKHTLRSILILFSLFMFAFKWSFSNGVLNKILYLPCYSHHRYMSSSLWGPWLTTLTITELSNQHFDRTWRFNNANIKTCHWTCSSSNSIHLQTTQLIPLNPC